MVQVDADKFIPDLDKQTDGPLYLRINDNSFCFLAT